MRAGVRLASARIGRGRRPARRARRALLGQRGSLRVRAPLGAAARRCRARAPATRHASARLHRLRRPRQVPHVPQRRMRAPPFE